MSITTFIQKPWNIPKKMAKTFCEEELENTVSALTRTAVGNFYFVDYHQRKLIVSSHVPPTILGYSKEDIEKEGFDFYDRVMHEKDQEWFSQLSLKAHELVAETVKPQRKNLVLNYNLRVKAMNRLNVVTSHTLTPYQFCRNGNLWLSLCHVKILNSPRAVHQASIVNKVTGEKYDYIDGKFQLSEIEAITQNDLILLRWMGDDMPVSRICELLNISTSNFCRKRKKLFRKLQVETPTGAVYKAQEMGII